MKYFALLSAVGSLTLLSNQSHSAGHPHLKELPASSYSLQGIVNGKNSEPFACHFGTFQVQVKEKKGGETLASIQGKGVLVNSHYLSPGVSTRNETLYRFTGKDIEDGTKLSAFCNDLGKPQETTVTYFIKERSGS